MPEGEVISLAAPEQQSSVEVIDPRTLDSLPDAALDAIPFGVIVLDAQGTIRRYNLAEARLARLDRATVIGKSFFGRVAPCTDTPEFAGRFKRYVAEARADVDRFEYLFDFKFGAQIVDVELVRSNDPSLWVLCINRRRFMPARADARAPAPRQADLTPGESALGVMRDADAQRTVKVPAQFFRAMRSTWDRVAPRGWGLFTGEWGVMWGRTIVVDLEAELLRRGKSGLRDESMQVVLDALRDRLLEEGWGALDFELAHARSSGLVVVHLERSAIAESVGGSSMPRCHLVAGMLTAFFSHLAERVVAVREVSCVAQGKPRCSFVMVDSPRRGQLERAIEASGHELDETLEILRTP